MNRKRKTAEEAISHPLPKRRLTKWQCFVKYGETEGNIPLYIVCVPISSFCHNIFC